MTSQVEQLAPDPEALVAASRTFEPTRAIQADRIPVTVITGFLGAGKTTLVNHILTNNQGVRAAVLVNELGDIGIDNDLIVTTDGAIVELSNGCICCSMNDDLVDGIVRILSHDGPLDHLIIETSGVSDPLPVALTVLRSEFRSALRLDAIVTVADAHQFSLDSHDTPTTQNQFRYADIVLVNKCDLVDTDERDRVLGRIAALTSHARHICTARSAVPLELILAVGAHTDTTIAPRGEHAHDTHDHRDGHSYQEGHLHVEADGFVSVSFESASPFSLPRFQDFLNAGRPPGLFRAKGFVWIAETDTGYLLHLVGDRFTLDRLESRAPGFNRLVFIGRGLDPDGLRDRVGRCLAPTDDIDADDGRAATATAEG